MKTLPIYDPFAGGGSIPLEAQRLGLKAVASDLNPVAVLLNKALIEIPPKFRNRPPVNPEADRIGMTVGKGKKKQRLPWRGASGLANDIRYYGAWMREEAFKRDRASLPEGKTTRRQQSHRDCVALGAYHSVPKPGVRRPDAPSENLPNLQKGKQCTLD